MQQILVLGAIFPRLVDPWQHLLDFGLVVVLHKLSAGT